VQAGDVVILIAYAQVDDAEARSFVPSVVFVDAENKVTRSGSDPADAPQGGLTRGDSLSPASR